MNQWRRFQFFDASQVNEEGSASPIQLSPKYDLDCCTSGHGTLVFGDKEGNIHLLGRDFHPVSFPAFDECVIKVHQLSSQNVLLAVGVDVVSESVKLTQLKVWHLDKEGKGGGPMLVRMQKIFPSKYPESKITCFTALDDMSHIAVGLANGAVILYRGDLMRDRINNKHKLLCPPGEAPVTGLAFRGMGKDGLLYVVTSESVRSFAVGNKSDNAVVLNDVLGGSPGCSVLSAEQDLVVGRTEAVYFFMGEETGPCFGLDGIKHFVAWFRGYLVVVSSDPARPAVANHIHIHDLKNKFIAFSGIFSDVKALLCEFGCIFAITGDFKVHQLKERDTQTKMETLFKKNLYSIALNLASSHNYDEPLVMDIYRKYGDHLYSKGDFDAAVDQYVKTIGNLEPSYVIRQFLDAQRTQNLTQYLQALHEQSSASSDHTTLLLNCYTKLKDTQKLTEFINDPSLRFDIDTAITVLRQAGYFKHALDLAKRHKQNSQCVRIMLDDTHEYNAALEFVWTLPFDQANAEMLKHGKALVTHLPDRATALLMALCTHYEPKTEQEVKSSAKAAAQVRSESMLSSALSHFLTTVHSLADQPLSIPGSQPARGPSAANPSNPAPNPSNPGNPGSGAQVAAPAREEAGLDALIGGDVPRRASTGKRARVGDFVHLYVSQPEWLTVFLEFMVAQNPAKASPLVNDTLLELYLRAEPEDELDALEPQVHKDDKDDKAKGGEQGAPKEDGKGKEESGCKEEDGELVGKTRRCGDRVLPPQQSEELKRQKALALLQNPNAQYSPDHALYLCQMHNFNEGALFLYTKQGMFREVLSVHMRAGNREQVLDTCLAQNDPELWVKVLRYFAADSKVDNTPYLTRLIAHIDKHNTLPPLAVVSALSDSPHVNIGLVKDFLLKRLQKDQRDIEQDRERIRSYQEETQRMRDEIQELRTSAKIFQSQKCADCTNPLKLPSCHFLCGHSFHQRCLVDDSECPICAQQNNKVLAMRREVLHNASNHAAFLQQLEQSPNGFMTIAEFFGHGIFQHDEEL